MSMFKLAYILSCLVLLVCAISYAKDRTIPPPLELKVKQSKPSDLFPGANGFSATLTNTSGRPIPIELLQLPPGYSGGGIFYACAVQFWNSKTKEWRTTPPGNRHSEHSIGRFIHSEIKPNETLEVCRSLFQREAIQGGKCARFAFTFHYDHKPDILSKPFVIPDPDQPGKTVRCPK